MKKTGVFLLVLLIAAAMTSQAVWAGGQRAAGAAPLTKVRVAMHSNAAGAGLFSVAIEKGFFAEYGIEAELTVVDSGPVEMAAMRADNPTLDFGYIGAGVAWNPIDTTGNSLSFIFFDILSNAERLLARKGIFSDSNGNGVFDYPEIYAGLRGKMVYFEIGTTAANWFKDLVEAVNENYPPANQLWLHCEDAAFLAGYTAPNNNPENRIFAVNYANSNIPAGMATAASNESVDVAVAYEPVPSTILRTVRDIELIADITALPKDKVFPSTVVANTKWMTSNPELAKNCVYALYKAALWRVNNPAESMRFAERLSAKPEGTFEESTFYSLTAQDYNTWFANPDSLGYVYMRALYNERLPNIPQGTTPKPFEQAVDFTYMLQAIKELK